MPQLINLSLIGPFLTLMSGYAEEEREEESLDRAAADRPHLS